MDVDVIGSMIKGKVEFVRQNSSLTRLCLQREDTDSMLPLLNFAKQEAMRIRLL